MCGSIDTHMGRTGAKRATRLFDFARTLVIT
jgi:hypothetical protein